MRRWLREVVRRRRPDLLAAAGLLLLAGALLWRPLLTGEVLLPADILYQFPPWRALAAQLGVATPHNDLLGDMVLQNLQWKTFARDQLLSGSVPLWNPHVLSGAPFLAGGQHGALYPLGVIFSILEVAQAYAWFTALHVFLAGAFTYALLRYLGTSWRGALIGAVSFEFTQCLLVSFLWPMVVSAAVWAPAVLLAVEATLRQWREGSVRRLPNSALLPAGVGAATVAVQALAGHLEITFYVLFTAGAWAAFRLSELAWRRRSLVAVVGPGATVLAMVALGLLAAGVLLIPFGELIGANFRVGQRSYETVVGYALPWRHLATFLVPDVFGNPSTHTWFDVASRTFRSFENAVDPGGVPKDYPFWGIKNYVEGAGYVGILPLMLAVAAPLVRRDGITRFLAAYGVVCLLLAFGTPLYALFFFLVPGFTQLNTPFRWLFPFAFCVALLAGFAADRLFDPARSARLRSVSAIGWVGLGTGLTVAVVCGAALLWPQAVQPWFDRVRATSELAQRAFPDPASFFGYQLRNLAVAGAFLLGSGLVLLGTLWASRTGRRAAVLAIAGAGLIVADLFVASGNFNTVAPVDLLDARPAAIEALQRLQAGGEQPWRTVTFDREAQRPLFPVSWMRYGVLDLRGYDTVILGRYVRFWRLLEEPQGLDGSMIHSLHEPGSLTSPLLDLMGARWVVTTQEIDLPALVEVYRGDGIVVYENADVLPRAFALPRNAAIAVADEAAALEATRALGQAVRARLVVETPAGVAAVTGDTAGPSVATAQPVLAYEPNRVVVRTGAAEAAWLVLTDSFFPGWRAFVDGVEVPMYRAWSIYRAVPVPAGDHVVEFRYAPDSFRLGVFASLVGVVLVGLTLVVWAWRRLGVVSGEVTTAQRVARNSLAPMAAQLASRGLDFAFAIFMLRYLGPADTGKYSFAVFVIGFFLLFVDYGLGTLLTREVARSRQDAERYLANTLTLRLGLLVASLPVLAVVIAIYALFFGLTEDTALTIVVLAVGLLPSLVAASLSAVFSAYERMEIPAAVGIVTNLARVSLSVGALLLGFGIVGLAAVSIIASLVTVAIFAGVVRAQGIVPRPGFDFAFQRSMLVTSAPLMINNFLSTVFFRIDVLLLRAFTGDLIVGYYTTAYKFIDGLNLIPSLFTLAAFPVMSRLATNARERLLVAYRVSLKGLLVVSLPIAAGTTAIAPQLVVTFFGEAFAPAVLALQVIIWFLPFSFVNSLTHYVLIAADQQGYLTRAFLVGVAFNVGGNLIAIPLFGFVGAAVVTILSEIVLLVPFLIGVRRHVGMVPLLGLAWRPALASGLMLAALWPLQWLNFLALIALGALVYAAALVALRTFDADDRALARSLLRRSAAPAG